eukprot:c25381_g2_i1 orf=59-262(-)
MCPSCHKLGSAHAHIFSHQEIKHRDMYRYVECNDHSYNLTFKSLMKKFCGLFEVDSPFNKFLPYVFT